MFTFLKTLSNEYHSFVRVGHALTFPIQPLFEDEIQTSRLGKAT